MESFRIPRGVELGLAAALAAAAFFSAPGTAKGAISEDLQNGFLTIQGDAEDDRVELGVAGGNITVNGAPTALPANANAIILVKGGGGADVLDASGLPAGAYRALTLIGEAGDDELTGGEESDEFFWNDGDGNDVVRGGEGRFDRLVAFGSETEDDEFRLVPGPTTKLEGANDSFAISLPDGQGEIEEVAAIMSGGDDSFIALPGLPDLLIVVGAGIGDDTIVGGDDADQLFGDLGNDKIDGGPGGDVLFGQGGTDEIVGGDGNDFLSGNEGNDRLTPNQGGGPALGGAGEDVIVWHAGDGVLEARGEEDFDQLEVRGTEAGDDFKAFTAGDTTTIEGTAPASTVTLNGGNGEFEEIAFLGGGGNDRFTVSAGLGLFAEALGEEGDDMLVGAEGFERFTGGPGADTLLGGDGPDLLLGNAGEDVIDGEEGDDSLRSRDQERDVVRGGAGEDTAMTDELTRDTVTDVEHLDALPTPPPPPPPPPPSRPADTEALLPSLSGIKVTRSGRKLIAQTQLTCPAEEAGGCRVTLTAEASRPSRGGGRGRLRLGAKIVELNPGEQRRVSIPFVAGAARLAKHGRLAVRIRIESSDAAGNDAARTAAVVLRIPRP
jgi:Ca2+-binding RTX toxin-like protein